MELSQVSLWVAVSFCRITQMFDYVANPYTVHYVALHIYIDVGWLQSLLIAFVECLHSPPHERINIRVYPCNFGRHLKIPRCYHSAAGKNGWKRFNSGVGSSQRYGEQCVQKSVDPGYLMYMGE